MCYASQLAMAESTFEPKLLNSLFQSPPAGRIRACGAEVPSAVPPGALQARSWALFLCYTIQRRAGPFLVPEAAPASVTPSRWALNERRAEQHTGLQSPPLTPSPPETPGQSSLVKRLLPDGGTRGRGSGASA